MTITLDYSPDSIAMIERQAEAESTTIEDFIRKASEKAARNAEYLAKLDRARQEIREGKVVTFSDDEWERFINAQNIR